MFLNLHPSAELNGHHLYDADPDGHLFASDRLRLDMIALLALLALLLRDVLIPIARSKAMKGRYLVISFPPRPSRELLRHIA